MLASRDNVETISMDIRFSELRSIPGLPGGTARSGQLPLSNPVRSLRGDGADIVVISVSPIIAVEKGHGVVANGAIVVLIVAPLLSQICLLKREYCLSLMLFKMYLSEKSLWFIDIASILA